jgi:hypothetical protein
MREHRKRRLRPLRFARNNDCEGWVGSFEAERTGCTAICSFAGLELYARTTKVVITVTRRKIYRGGPPRKAQGPF